MLQRGRGCPCGCQAPQLHAHNPSFTGPEARGTQRAATVGPGMQSQQCPGEISTVELVKRDHPEDLVCTASDSRHEQPHGQRCQAGRQPLQLTSPCSTPFKDRELRAVQRPCLRPEAFASPAPHLLWLGRGASPPPGFKSGLVTF